MTNPFQHTPFQSGADFTDPLGFVKKLWGDMQIPGMVTPTISVDELDQQIKDLKAVESWLTLNMNMLRGSIQALEVQRSTIAALKTMGESFAQNNATKDNASQSKAPVNDQDWPLPQEANAWWNVVQDQFKQALSQMIPEEGAIEPKAPNKVKKPASKTKPAAKKKATSTKSKVAKISKKKTKTD